ncbi:NADH-quinone oxidoreductase [Rhizoctonia solani AG-1 IA]|uniref:NADH-quinone oxidoreductase n=1 Tax=Thanatephorus cucumeris (strain AG1-IA) TaxID=983506 RepID=L8X0S6_THACA|nr:NADH-quinone oxidoreductase [Rhizoctonia solani AG-1 IA]
MAVKIGECNKRCNEICRLNLYGHIGQLAQEVKKGIESEGVEVTLFQVPETLTPEILTKLGAPPRNTEIPTITPDDLKNFDGFAFVPTRYGRAPAQISAFFDATGGLWATQALSKKFATVFVSTGSQNGGQETTALTTMPFFAHHGIIYVPLGYRAPELGGVKDIRGGGPFGAGTIASSDGSRQPSAEELTVAQTHGKHFAEVVKTYKKGEAAA